MRSGNQGYTARFFENYFQVFEGIDKVMRISQLDLIYMEMRCRSNQDRFGVLARRLKYGSRFTACTDKGDAGVGLDAKCPGKI